MSEEDTVTMTKSEAASLQNAYNMLNKLYNHPDKSMDFKKLARDAGFKVPEVETLERFTKPYDEKMTGLEKKNKELSERLDKWENETLSTKEEAKLREQLDSARKEYSLSDEGMAKVIARMKEKNNPDVEAAAAFVLSKEPKAKPTTNTHNFAPGKFKGSEFVGGGDDGEKAWKTLMNDAATGSDDFFTDVVNDVFNHPEEQRELGGVK
jgi:hypothetical protein